jgi:hypothetical protein
MRGNRRIPGAYMDEDMEQDSENEIINRQMIAERRRMLNEGGAGDMLDENENEF